MPGNDREIGPGANVEDDSRFIPAIEPEPVRIGLEDIIYEISNIGTSHAATALSKLLDKRVNITVPRVEFVDLDAYMDEDRVGEEAEMLAIKFYYDNPEAMDSRQGIIMLVFDQANLASLQTILTGELVEVNLGRMDEDCVSMFCEIGNILASQYLSSISNFFGSRLNLTSPIMAVAPFKDTVGNSLMEMSIYTRTVFIIKNSLSVGSNVLEMDMVMFFDRQVISAIEEYLVG